MSGYDPDLDDDLVIEQAPFEQAPNDLWVGGPKAGGCTPRAVVTYLALRKLGAERDFRISRKKLANVQGVSIRTVDNACEELVKKGWLLITPSFRDTGDRQQSSNRYTLLWTPITSKDDARWKRHQRAVDLFSSDMDGRLAANLLRDEEEAARMGVSLTELRRVRKGRKGKQDLSETPVQKTAGGGNGHDEAPPSQKTAGAPLQETAGGPSQKTAGEDPYLHTHTSNTHTSVDGSAADESGEGAGGAQIFELKAPTTRGVTARVPLDVEALFAEFHSLYPKKDSPSAAKKAWLAALKRKDPITNERPDPRTIVEAARTIAEHRLCPRRKDGSSSDQDAAARWKYMKLETTWLNQGQWAADYPVWQKWEDDEAESKARGRGGKPDGFYRTSEYDDSSDWFDTPSQRSGGAR